MNNLHNAAPFVVNPIARACTPPLVRTCDFDSCRCDEAPPLNPLTRPCRPPQELVCFPEAQTCTCVAEQPAVVAPPAAEDGCAIVAAVIVAGIKKTLLACWVDG